MIRNLKSSHDLSPRLDVVFYDSSLQADFGIVVVVMHLRGKCVICATIQHPSDKSNDEHLHDHHLLTKHCRMETKKKQDYVLIILPHTPAADAE